MTDAPTLKPCPFCGGEAELWQAHPGRKAWVACMGRCAVLVTAEHQTNEEAIATWNNRAFPADDAEMVVSIIRDCAGFGAIAAEPFVEERLVTRIKDEAERRARAALSAMRGET